jgi:type VI secretion system protein ImpL
MFAFLKRTFVLLIGLALIVVVVWYAGPFFAFADYRPLESATARLIVIAAIVGCWLLLKAVKRLRSFRASDRLLAAVAAQPQPPAEKSRPPAEVQKLRERFDEAVTALKEQRRSGHSLYDLPWYVIIGAPGSGKTTALLNSGLRFPLEQRVGKGALRGVGGTRNCDWWFTEDAIFLDTAGRYTTQDSDAASDSLGWREFLGLLRKYRARRPINGVILTINAHDLIAEGAGAREAHVDAARSRLEELNRELNIQLPVYLMVTKCDLVDGFTEYFDDLTAQGRAQVWGVTFPYEQTLANESPQQYPAEFDALMTRLNERVFTRVEEVRDTRRRAKVFAFPQQMATMREALTQFVSDVFGARHFTGEVLLRGVYFTSGTQDGTPIDRLLGSIGRSFGAAVRPSSGPGKAYFVETLLKDVMIGESGLAGINRRLEGRKAAALLGAYAAAGLVAVAGILALSVNYSRNHAFLEEARGEIEALDHVPPVAPSAPLEQTVPRLDAISAVVDSADRYRDSVTWAARWGLYQGSSIGNSARDAYFRELDGTLLPRVASLLRARVREYSSQPARLFPYFKGYLMLGYPEHFDKAHLQMLTDAEWKRPGAGPAGAALARHLNNLLETGETLPPLPLDSTVVNQGRSSIRQASMSRLLYDEIKRAYLGKPDHAVHLDQQLGFDFDKVFRRQTGVPLSTPIPGLFTPPAFKEIATQGQALLIAKLKQDAWVWGDDAVSALTRASTVVSDVLRYYEADYTTAWDELLNDLEFASGSTLEQTKESFRILTSPASPLKGVFRIVGDNTALARNAPAAEPKGTLDKATSEVSKAITGALKPFQEAAGLPAGEPGRGVTAHFNWVRQLTAGEPAPIDGIIKTLSEILQQLDTIGADVAGTQLRQVLASASFRSLVQSLRQQAATLPPAIGTLVSEMARAAERSVIVGTTVEIDSIYEQQVLAGCRRLIANRYPFADAGQPDVQLSDFSSVFGASGLFDKFFEDYLNNQVDTTKSPWEWKPGSVTPKRQMLQQLQAAAMVRDMFFPAGAKTPEVRFNVTISDLDAGASRFVLQIDGSLFDGAHRGPVRAPAVWPGPQSGLVTAAFEGTKIFVPPAAYQGPWAWFRMIDATAEGAADGQQRVRLNVQSEGHRAVVAVEPVRATGNPFSTRSWRQFSCES